MDDRIRQRIRYLLTPDGVKLAWAEAGTGPALVKASNWLTHLEHDLESPVWRHWIRFFAGHSRFIRYDERGCGMTDWNVPDLATFSGWLDDLDAVVTAAAPAEPFALLGISQGAAICAAYAAAHPDRVSSLVLYGGYARGWRRDTPEGAREHRAIVELARIGWGKDNAAFREVFTSRFIPGGTRAQIDWFNDICRRTTTGDNAGDLLCNRTTMDASSLLDKVRAPTLVLHARDDQVIPLDKGRFLASHIPGAEFVELESRNHILLEEEPAWERFCGAVREFLGWSHPPVRRAEDAVFAALTARERGILSLITEGLSNADIADRLGIGEKTVRNHISNLFDKLGVDSRAQAMVFARDRGFGG